LLRYITKRAVNKSAPKPAVLFDFNRNYASILYRFRVIVHFLSKVAKFNPSHLHLSPP